MTDYKDDITQLLQENTRLLQERDKFRSIAISLLHYEDHDANLENGFALWTALIARTRAALEK